MVTQLPNDEDEISVFTDEFHHGINDYLATHNSEMKNLQDIINFNRADLETRAPFGQNLLENAVISNDTSQIRDHIQILAKNALDHMLQGNNVLLGDDPKLINLAAISGYPSLSVPTGSSDDVYFHGLTSMVIVAKPFNEIALKVIGESIETHHQRLIPEF
jgi:amidase